MCNRVLLTYIDLLISIVQWITHHITDKLIQKTDENILKHRRYSARVYNKLAKISNELAKVIINYARKIFSKLKGE